MGFLDRLLGNSDAKAAVSRGPQSPDAALERYRYMLQTAPPGTIERAHEEAFQKLTPEQRRQLLAELAEAAPDGERDAVEATPADDPKALARVATRAEIRQPGIMERALGGSGMGLGGSLLSSFAMGFVGSMVAQSFFSTLDGGGSGASDEASAEEAPEDGGSSDPGTEEDLTGDGDFDGGDFDGGDFEL